MLRRFLYNLRLRRATKKALKRSRNYFLVEHLQQVPIPVNYDELAEIRFKGSYKSYCRRLGQR